MAIKLHLIHRATIVTQHVMCVDTPEVHRTLTLIRAIRLVIMNVEQQEV